VPYALQALYGTAALLGFGLGLYFGLQLGSVALAVLTALNGAVFLVLMAGAAVDLVLRWRERRQEQGPGR
jgi:hypothetical protein